MAGAYVHTLAGAAGAWFIRTRHAFLSICWRRCDVAGGAILDKYRKGDIYTTVLGRANKNTATATTVATATYTNYYQ